MQIVNVVEGAPLLVVLEDILKRSRAQNFQEKCFEDPTRAITSVLKLRRRTDSDYNDSTTQTAVTRVADLPRLAWHEWKRKLATRAPSRRRWVTEDSATNGFQPSLSHMGQTYKDMCAACGGHSDDEEPMHMACEESELPESLHKQSKQCLPTGCSMLTCMTLAMTLEMICACQCMMSLMQRVAAHPVVSVLDMPHRAVEPEWTLQAVCDFAAARCKTCQMSSSHAMLWSAAQQLLCAGKLRVMMILVLWCLEVFASLCASLVQVVLSGLQWRQIIRRAWYNAHEPEEKETYKKPVPNSALPSKHT